MRRGRYYGAGRPAGADRGSFLSARFARPSLPAASLQEGMTASRESPAPALEPYVIFYWLCLWRGLPWRKTLSHSFSLFLSPFLRHSFALLFFPAIYTLTFPLYPSLHMARRVSLCGLFAFFNFVLTVICLCNILISFSRLFQTNLILLNRSCWPFVI